MLWVNDFWTLNNIPKWLKHATSGENYLGFSDLIFPWFLFVMGMSIPFSFENRLKKSETDLDILKHIIFRTIALIILGLYHMNMEMYNHNSSLISKPYFVIMCTTAFFMIWNKYPKPKSDDNIFLNILPTIGIVILLGSLFLYKGQNYNGLPIGFRIHWWGILGLIGWSYFIVASSYFIFRRSILGAIIAFFICVGINILSSSGIAYNIFSWQSIDWIPGSGGLQALTFGGVITSLILMKYKNNFMDIYFILFGMGVTSLIGGLYLKQYFIISKINGTPTWILISMSTALFFYMLIHWIVDVHGKIKWYKPIKIAGTATLSCYLIPYFYYSFKTILDIELPSFFITGVIGLLKSIIYSFIIIAIAGIMKRINIQLKI
jgi:predicted acyltransferase